MEAFLPMVLKMLLQTAGPDIEKLLREKLVLEVVPDKVSDALASSLDANGTKWVQAALNVIDGAELDVGSKYGPATRAAVEKFPHGRRLGRRQHQRRASGRAAQRRVTCTRSRASLTGHRPVSTPQTAEQLSK